MNSVQDDLLAIRRVLMFHEIAHLIGSKHYQQVQRMLKTGIAAESTARLIKLLRYFIETDRLNKFKDILNS
jgi:hypothetical protein